tara:strand:- start:17518 stop:18204 length:687 start_codon:yes stop_codon:yes gene_type:complete
MKQPKVLAVIPARGGSKGLPGKNIKVLGGKPLIAWTIDAALNANFIEKTVVTTDCQDIAIVAKNFGAEIPFIRPAELGSDTATTSDVVSHVLNSMQEKYDIIILLQPTSPFRTTKDIENAFELYKSTSTSSVVSVYLADKSPYWYFTRDNIGIINPVLNMEGQFSRRQELPDTYLLNGAIYIVDVKKFLSYEKFIFDDSLSYVMSKESSIDIDEAIDFQLAQLILGVK